MISVPRLFKHDSYSKLAEQRLKIQNDYKPFAPSQYKLPTRIFPLHLQIF